MSICGGAQLLMAGKNRDPQPIGNDHPLAFNEALEEKISNEVAEFMEPLYAILAKDALTEAEVHLLLQASFKLQQIATSGGGLYVGAVFWAARKLGQAIMDTAFSWLNESLRPGKDQQSQWARTEVTAAIAYFPSPVPLQERIKVYAAFLELDNGSGKLPSYLAPCRKQGRGPDPVRARHWEMVFWLWITHQTVLGAKTYDVVNQVAAAAGVGPEAVRAWLTSWKRRRGKKEVEASLDELKQEWKSGPGADLPSLEEIARNWRRCRGMTSESGDARSKGSQKSYVN
jgi:hypothetical protein